MTTVPQTKAMATDTRIPPIIAIALPVLIISAIVAGEPSGIVASVPSEILNTHTPTAAPSKPNTSETVVEVGIPSVLKRSNRMTLVSITARNSIMTSAKVNRAGWNTPLRATSIIPLEVMAPTMIPTEATVIITYRGAALDPSAEFRKFTASLATPTTSPDTASASMMRTTIRYKSINPKFFILIQKAPEFRFGNFFPVAAP